MNRLSVIAGRATAVRHFASAAPKTSTGIEHAEAFKKTGMQQPADPKAYKCDEYLHFNVYSYYDKEIDMAAMRAPQPTNKKPDVMPKFK